MVFYEELAFIYNNNEFIIYTTLSFGVFCSVMLIRKQKFIQSVFGLFH